jgi:hypothetical protein
MKILTLVILYCLFYFNFFAQLDQKKQKWISLNGYVKSLQSANFVTNIDSLTSSNLLHNRLNFKFNISPKLTARLEIRNRIFYGEQVKQIPEFGKIINQYNGFFDLSKLWVDEKSIVIHSVIDRVLIQYASEKWDIKIGRQRINWGVNTVWNPNDIYNAYNVLDFDYEERPGNDAIRLQRFFKRNSSVEFAVKPGKKKDETIATGLFKFNKSKYDIQILSGVYLSDIVVGCGWAGNIKDAGFKGEMSYFHPQKNTMDTTGSFSASVMVDRTFKNNWYGSLAFLYNSKPNNMMLGSSSIYGSTLSPKSLFPFEYNIYGGIIKTLTPITSINFSVIYSPENNTLIFLPTFAWNVATNFDLDFTVQSFNASQNDSYESLGNSIYIRVRWSF